MTDLHGLSVPQADAIWDAIAIPGPRQPTFMEQYERACKTVATLLKERPCQDVQGRCPACHWQTLFLADGGHVTCSRIDCPNPTAADELLHGEHVGAATPLVCSDERHAAKVADLERQLAALREVARGYCPHCGRGDASPTAHHWEEQKQRADQAEELLSIAHDTSNKSEAERVRAAAVIARVRATCDQLHRAAVLADGQPHTDRERGIVQAVSRVLAALGEPTPAATQATDDQLARILTTMLADFRPEHGTNHETLRLDTETLDRYRAVLDPPPATTATSHSYLSTGCFHGDTVLADGRTGHQYCQSETGKSGAKTPAQCKFCGAPCTCPCHKERLHA